MRYKLVLIMILASFLAGTVAQCDTWTLIVGINGYQSINKLTYAVNDAVSFCNVMSDPNLGKVDKSRIRLLVDGSEEKYKTDMPTGKSILTALDSINANIKSGDRLIFFFTGHGVSAGSKSYLIPIDAAATGANLNLDTCISADEIITRLSSTKASEVLLFIDACRDVTDGAKGLSSDDSAIMTDSFAKAFEVKPRDRGPQMTATFYACNIKEKAFEWPEQRHGVFTYYLLEGLCGGATHPGAKSVTLNQLEEYVGNEVEKHRISYPVHSQTPWVIKNGKAGSLILSYAHGQNIVTPSPTQKFAGRISVSFPGQERCPAKSALIKELYKKGFDAVDLLSRAAKDKKNPIKAKITGRYSSEKRETNVYDIDITSLDAIMTIAVSDKTNGRDWGPEEIIGSMPILSSERRSETDAIKRAAEAAAKYIEESLHKAE